MNDCLSVSIDDHVAEVRLNRPDRMNALDLDLMIALGEAADALTGNPKVRAVILSGAGPAFCSGLDTSMMPRLFHLIDKGALADGPFAADRPDGTNIFQYAVWGWRKLSVPVIAAIHGFAYGGGFQIMLGADIRYAAPDAKFSVLEIKWGLVPDMAGPQLMRQLARDDIVRELTYTGRSILAEEALALGFLTRVCSDPWTSALKTAHEIAAKSPDAIRATKRLLNDVPNLDLAGGFAAEAREQLRLIGSANQREAAGAALEQRSPRFVDPSS